MRILYVSHSFPLPGRPLSNVGGMQRLATDLRRALGAHPDLHLSTLGLETSWQWTGVRTPPFVLSLLRRIPRIVREQGIEAVLFSSMVTASVAPVLRNRVRAAGAITAVIPVGRDLTLPNPIYQRMVPRVLRDIDLILPISRATAAAALARGAPAERIHVVPCGVEMRVAPPPADRHARRTLLFSYLRRAGHRIRDDALLLLSVGRHQERKGFHWFIEQVVPRLEPNTVYLLVGSGPMTKAIRAAVDAAGLNDRALVLGQVTDEELSTLYSGADLFVMPNVPVAGDIEGFGLVMIEAGAAGLPVIASDLEGIRDVVTPDENGRLVAAHDTAAFVREIGCYGDPEYRAAASRRAEQHVRASFGWPAIADRYVTLLRAAWVRSAAEGAHAAPEAWKETAQDLGDEPQEDRAEQKADNHEGSVLG